MTAKYCVTMIHTGLSCLHMAVLSGVVDKAAYLIDKVGLKVNAKDGMGAYDRIMYS